MLPKEKQANIYDVLNSAYLPFKLCGMGPYKRKIVNKKYTFESQKDSYVYTAYILILSIIIWNSMLIILLEDIKKPNLTIHEMLILMLYFGTCIAAVLTMILFMKNNEQFIRGLNNLHKADLLMKQLRIQVAYLLPTLITYGQALFSSTSVCSMIVYEYWVIKKPLPRIVHEKLSFHLSLVILATANYHYIGVVLLLFMRFRRINKFLENLEHETDDLYVNEKHLYSKRSIIFTLRAITEMYDQLLSCAKQINETFSVSLFCFIQLMTLGLLGQMFSFLSTSHVFSTQTNIAGFIIYAIFLLPILIPSEITMNEANKTTGLMGLISICYFNEKAAIERNTFLLQCTHQKLNLSACGIHNLCVGVLIKQINAINTFLIFFLQLQPNNKN